MKKPLGAFSLVEMMISLITISLISAAFAPIITKKLSKSLLFVGNFGESVNNGNDGGKADICGGKTCDDGYYMDEESCQCKKCSQGCEKCSSATNCIQCQTEYGWSDQYKRCVNQTCAATNGNPSEACCQSMNAKYLPKSLTGLDNDLCMMMYNAGDEPFTSPSNFEYVKYGIAFNKAGETCISSRAGKYHCCWKGVDGATTGSGDSVMNSGYGGTGRTSCLYAARDTICDNISPGDSIPGSWRTITNAELAKLATIITAETENNGVISRYLKNTPDADGTINYANYGLQLCDSVASYGANQCASASTCKSSKASKCNPNEIYGNEAHSAYQLVKGKFSVHLWRHQGGTNTYTGDPWYINDDNNAGVRCVSVNIYNKNSTSGTLSQESTTFTTNEPRSQTDCELYNSFFINKKYVGTSKNICVMYRNYGDTDNTDKNDESNFDVTDENGNTVILKTAGTTADNNCTTSYCCWKGITSSGGEEHPYSPAKRTVCRYDAAFALCDNFTPKVTINGSIITMSNLKGKWKLPTTGMLNNLAVYLDSDASLSHFFSKYVDTPDYSLQFCDSDSDTLGSNKCADSGNCKGASSNKCSPSRIWSDDVNKSYRFSKGIFTSDKQTGFAQSVRCVTDTVVYPENIKK